MLRRKLSAGLLRASAQATAPSTAGLIAKPPQSANLASAVLLSSQRNWRDETVVTLKNELKRRGLSQAGKKADLIARINSSDITNFLPPPPPLSAVRKAASTPSLKLRALSTSTPRSQPSKEPAPSSETEPVTSSGPAISSQKTDAPKVEKIDPENVTVAPGLPETKDADEGLENVFTIKIPAPKAEGEIDQIIPFTPDNFRSNTVRATESASTSAAEEQGLPKVVTVASSATHLAGGPSHAVHETSDASTLEAQSPESAVETIQNELPGLGAAIANAFSAPGRALKAAEVGKAFLPEVGLPGGSKDGGSGGQQYKANDKPLDAEEKRGAYILAGIVGLGWLIGGPKGGNSKKDSKSSGGSSKGKGSSGSSKAVKGDAQWEKASGAGVVGHGARKE